MSKKFLPSVFIFLIYFSSALSSAEIRNYQSEIAWSGCHAKDQNCYPMFYEDINGTSNTFSNFISGINFFCPLITLSGLKLCNYFTSKWDNNIKEKIELDLKTIAKSESNIRILLKNIIHTFNNGIGAGQDDRVISSIVEDLNRKNCSNCADEFVTIVAANCINPKTEKNNRQKFRQFSQTFSDNQECLNHQYQQIYHYEPEEKSFSKMTQSACCHKWTHPFHWSSITYTCTSLVLPPCISLLLDGKNRAGSFLGDIANVSNALIIPSIQAFNLFQYWCNLDRIHAQKFSTELERLIANNYVIIEIASRIIGKIDNEIDEQHAKAILIALILADWPNSEVAQFADLASNQKTTKQQVNQFLRKLTNQCKHKNLWYRFDMLEDITVENGQAEPEDV